mgnify:CR=1 FL=1
MKILQEIKPTEEEKKSVKRIIDSVLKNIKIKDAKLELGGSYAKDTFLKGNHDIDVFVRFPYKKYKNKDISTILDKSISIRHKRLHGSRDYFQLEKNGYTFEFIPVLNIKSSEKAKNITDVSPLHKEWVIKNLKNHDDARLIKKFCRAQEVYGAESYIKGFSGYVLEILTVYYRTFINVVKNVSSWKLPVYIDVSKHHKNKDEAFRKINKSKRENELVIVDPTQKDRNAAAAISKEKIEKLISACKNYLHNPSDDFFVEKTVNIEDLKTEAAENNLLLIKINPLNGKKDVVGSKILKAYSYIESRLIKLGFKIIKSGWSFNHDSILYYIVKDEILSKTILHYGPPLEHEKFVAEFRKKHKNAKIYGGKISVGIKREARNLKEFSRIIKKDDYLRDKIKKIEVKIF